MSSASTMHTTRWLMVAVLGACGRPAAPAPAPAPHAVAPAPPAQGNPCDSEAGGLAGRYGPAACERAELRWTERVDDDGTCVRDYAVALTDPTDGSERIVALDTFPCPHTWWRCGPTPRCEPGMQMRTDWQVTLQGVFPIGEAQRDGLMVRVADPAGDVVRFYDVAGPERWHFGTRRADHVFVTASRVEILVCEELEPVRVFGVLDRRLVEYPEPPSAGVTCSELW